MVLENALVSKVGSNRDNNHGATMPMRRPPRLVRIRRPTTAVAAERSRGAIRRLGTMLRAYWQNSDDAKLATLTMSNKSVKVGRFHMPRLDSVLWKRTRAKLPASRVDYK